MNRAVQAVRGLLRRRRRFAAALVVPGGDSGILARLAAAASEEFGIPVSQFVVMAASPITAHVLKCRIGDAVSRGTPLENLFFDHMAGSVRDVMRHASWQLPLISPPQRRLLINEYLLLIRRAAGGGDGLDEYLRAVRRSIVTALEVINRSRLQERSLAEVHAELTVSGALAALPALSMIAEISDFYRDAKSRMNVVDDADIYSGMLYPQDDVPLLLIDAVDVPRLAKRAVARVFPRAAALLVGDDLAALKEWFSILPKGERMLV